MADDIFFDIPPGYLLNPTQVNLQLSDRVTGLQYTVNGIAPSISKYIAYDTLNPPNPFIAVTQDGKGNVVYDGGFPKFYDARAPAESVTVFAELSASFKYLFNALRFIENKTKRALGNNKVLLIGDSVVNYRVDRSGGNHFGNSFARIATIGGYSLTVKTRANYPDSVIGCTLEELEEYCCVVIISSHNHTSSLRLITEEAIDAFVDYRENGSGILVVTDHGPNLATLAAAQGTHGAAFFTTANRIVARFGAWFSGTYSRRPVNVGYIRDNFGDHPLYNGMADSENIHADVSESQVFVEPFEPILPDEVTPFDIGDGRTLIQIAAVLDTGEVVTYRAEYNVVQAKVSFTDGNVIRDNGQVLDLGLGNRSTVGLILDSPDLNTFAGFIGVVRINGQRVGEVEYVPEQGTVFTWDDHDGGALLFNNGDVVDVTFDEIGLKSSITIRRFQPPIAGQLSLAVIHSLLRSYRPELTGINRVKQLMREIGDIVPWQRQEYVQNNPQNFDALTKYFNNDPSYINDSRTYMEGIANHWTLSDSLSPNIGSAVGILDGEIEFSQIDGIDALYLVNGSLTLPAFTVLGEGPWTFNLWYRPISLGQYTHLLTSTIRQGTFALKISPISGQWGERFYPHSSNTGSLMSNSGVPLDEWSMLTFSYDATTVRLYLNGRLDGQYDAAFNVPETGFMIGRGHTTEHSHGYQRDLMHWPRALTDDEVNMLYRDTAGYMRGESA